MRAWGSGDGRLSSSADGLELPALGPTSYFSSGALWSGGSQMQMSFSLSQAFSPGSLDQRPFPLVPLPITDLNLFFPITINGLLFLLFHGN